VTHSLLLFAEEVTSNESICYFRQVLPWVKLKHTNGLSQIFNFDENLVVP